MPEEYLNDDTSVPMKWLIALLVGCASFTGGAVFVGMYFGGRDANASAIVLRVERLEVAVDAMGMVDRRLARIEGALHIPIPEEDRLPASGRRHEGP